MPRLITAFFVLYLGFIFIFSLHDEGAAPSQPKAKADLDSIIKRGNINILVEHNSFNYYIYKGTPMGFQYELANDFAKFLGVRCNIILSDDLNRSFANVAFDSCDVLTSDITLMPKRYPGICLSDSLYSYRAVVALYSPDEKKYKIENAVKKYFTGWQKYHFVVPNGSCFPQMMELLNDSFGIALKHLCFRNTEPEELLTMVSEGKIHATICDEHVALANLGILPNLKFYYLPFKARPLGWAVSCKAPKLKEKLDEFLHLKSTIQKINFFKVKYFTPYSTFFFENANFHSKKGNHLSKYDRQMKKISRKYGFDWRLVASVVYQESNFKEGYVSYNGAMGLMQLMPGTAARYGLNGSSPADKQLEGGIHLMYDINQSFLPVAPDSNERMQFTLAAYNLGDAHIYDAIELAKKNNSDPSVWKNVEYWLEQKSKPRYYHDPVVKYGYCNPRYVKIFIRQVLERYRHYCNLFPK